MRKKKLVRKTSKRDIKSLADLAGIKPKKKEPEKPPVPEKKKEELETLDQINSKARRYKNLKPAIAYHPDEGWMEWHGFKIPTVSGQASEFFDLIENRRKQNKSCMVIITGDPGGGKTYAGLRLGEIFDQNFKVEHTPYDEPSRSQVTFGRKQLMHLIGNETPLQREQVIIIDEAQFAMGSRRWYEDIQKDLIEQIEAVRSRGFVIIIVALHLNLLDSIIRRYVLTYMIHMEDRGKGTVYRLYTPRFESEMRKKRLGQLILQIPNYEQCKHPDCLRCPYLHANHKDNKEKQECQLLRAVYERSKTAFIGNKNEEKEAQHEARERKRAEKIPVVTQLEKAEARVTKDIQKSVQRETAEADIASKLIDHQDELRFNERSNVYEASSAQEVLEKYYNVVIGRERAKRILKIIQKRLK